jgi:hypothetical protein
MDHIADALHVDDHEVLAIGIHDAFELADHGGLRSCNGGDHAGASAIGLSALI